MTGDPQPRSIADIERLEQLYKDSYPAVLRVCINRLGDHRDAEDAVQEVFSRAVSHSAKLEANALPWLLTVARNVCTDELRRRKTPVHSLDDSENHEEYAAASHHEPEEHVVGQMRVRELLARLSAAERRVITQKWLLDRTHEEAGGQLGISPGTTRQLVRRARKRLIAYMKEHEGLELGAIFAGLAAAWRKVTSRQEWTGQAVAMVQPWVAMTVPLMLVLTGPGLAEGSAVAAANSSGSRAVAVSDAAVHLACATPVCAAGTNSAETSTGTAHAAAAAPAVNHSSVALLLPGADPQSVQRFSPDDATASPNYSTDHTMIATGTQTSCNSVNCTALWRSTDSAHTWTKLAATGLQGTQILLPASSFSLGRFYAFGPAGLQVTTDGGNTFTPLFPSAAGFASAAPAGSGYDVVVSDTTVWGFSGSVSRPLSVLPTGLVARGRPAMVKEGLAWHVIAAVGQAGGTSVTIADCNPDGCKQRATLPWGQATDVTASPISGGTLLASSGAGLATSTDNGQSWHVLAGLTQPVRDSALVASGTTTRVVLLVVVGKSMSVIYSDDLGGSWLTAAGSPSDAAVLRQLTASELFTIRVANTTTAKFFCSTQSAAAWGAC